MIGGPDVVGEAQEQDGRDQQHPPAQIREKQREEGGGHAEDREPETVHPLTAVVAVRKILEQQRQEHDGDGGDEEEELPADRAEHTGGEHADGGGELIPRGEQAEEDDLERVLEILRGHDQVGRTGDLLTGGLQHTGDDDGPQIRTEIIVRDESEQGPDEQRHEAEGHEFLERYEVAEGTVDEAHDAEHDAGQRRDERRLSGCPHGLPHLGEHQVEPLQAQRAQNEGDEQRDQCPYGHGIGLLIHVRGVRTHGNRVIRMIRHDIDTFP